MNTVTLKALTIQNEATNQITYQRGKSLYMQNKVLKCEIVQVKDDTREARGLISGSTGKQYRAAVAFVQENAEEKIAAYDCSCPAMAAYYGMCKHCVALALKYKNDENQFAEQEDRRRRQEEIQNQNKKESITNPELLGFFRQEAESARQQENDEQIKENSVALYPMFCYYPYTDKLCAGFQIGVGTKKYIVKNVCDLVTRVKWELEFSYGKNLTFIHKRSVFTEHAQQILDLLEQLTAAESAVSSYGYTGKYDRYIKLNDSALELFFNMESPGKIILEDREIPVTDGNPPVFMNICGETGSASIELPMLYGVTVGSRPYLYYQGTLYHCSNVFAKKVLPFYRAVKAMEPFSAGTFYEKNQLLTLKLGEEDFRSFCKTVLHEFDEWIDIRKKNIDFEPYEPIEPRYLFYISADADGRMLLRPVVAYDDTEFPLFDETENEIRQKQLEMQVRSVITPFFDPTQGQLLPVRDNDAAYDFLNGGLENLRGIGEVLVEDSAKHVRVNRQPSVGVSVKTKHGLIDLDFRVDDLTPAEIEEVLSAYVQKKKYYRLQSGEFISLEDGGLSVLSEMAENLQLRDLSHATIPLVYAQYVNTMVTKQDAMLDVERSSDFKSVVHRLREYTDGEYPVPEELQATLRSYQKTGFRWLCTLSDLGLGGILADDMGLGKTVQTIAFLLHLKETALIVCPASLVYNWEAEFEKFAPSVRVVSVLGTAKERKELLDTEADVFVTSYDLLKRDEDVYEAHSFGTVILDEAQYIRNAATKAAHSVKALRANRRFALTGTPIANRLNDLWSIFDFILPGYLYTGKKFVSLYETPISKGDESAKVNLTRMTDPFILRRRKNDVLKELPDKVEIVRSVEMTEEQRKIYRAQEASLRLSLMKDDDTSFRQNRIQYLAALTRLRQLCCTPELYLENYTGGSGKVDACMELLEEAIGGEHKTLVFSQFTTMLDALCREADARGISYLCLTGSNTKEERKKMIDAFQAGTVSVFFISLKAGGTGLNLTAADRVIHFDPWWNAAAEDQATDRAHRIGQTQTVFVTKLVAHQSIEERIIEMQNSKRALVDSVLSDDDREEAVFDRDGLISLLSER